MDLFVDIGQTCREADEFLKKKSEATSPMLKLKLLQESLVWVDRFQQLQGRVNARREELKSQLQDLNVAWEAAPPIGSEDRPKGLPVESLEQVYRSFSYVDRWTGQIQERLVQFAL